MTNKTTEKIKEEYYEICPHYTGDEYNDACQKIIAPNVECTCYVETVWNFIEKVISQSKEELVDKVIELSSKYWIDKYVGTEMPLIVNKVQFKKFILEDLNRK